MTRSLIIKVCGVTVPGQVTEIVEAGASWIGLNFWPQSSRYLSPRAAMEVAKEIPDHIVKVGVFVDAPPEVIQARIEDCGLQKVQLHGNEPVTELDAYSVPAFKAIKAATLDDLNEVHQYISQDAPLFLVDAKHPSLPGGTGLQVDESVAHAAARMGKCLLAGGLNPQNVGQAVCWARPFGVDVASGVETAPGIKSIEAVHAFTQAAMQAFQTEDLRRESPRGTLGS